MRTHLGQMIRQLRKSRGLTQVDLARAIDVSSGQVISDWERGYGARPPVQAMRRLIRYFGLAEEEVRRIYLDSEIQRLARDIEGAWCKGSPPAPDFPPIPENAAESSVI